MIKLLLLFPLVACLLMPLIKNRTANCWLVNTYATLHFIITSFFALNSVMGLGFNTENSYFAVDSTNLIFLMILSIVFLMVAIYNTGYTRNFECNNIKIRNYSFMIMAFVFSMTGTLLSTDLGIAWTLVEATTLSSAYLIYFNKTKHSIEAAWKYVFICSIGISMAFVGIILLNVATGDINSMNFETLYQNATSFDNDWLKLAFVFMLFGFGAKMGLAPTHFWLPDAHSEAPSPISALLSATLLNSAFLVIIKVLKVLEIANCANYARIMLAVMGFLSIFVTAVFVYHIKNYKRMLAYSSIENMGILAIGTACGAYYAVILHLIGHSLAKASFFLSAGNVLELFETKRVQSVTGLLKAEGKTGWLWILSFLAICAFPTSILFISEFLIIKTMIAQCHYALCALFVTLLTIVLFGLAKVVLNMALGNLDAEKMNFIEQNKCKLSLFMYVPQFVLLTIVFTLGIYIPQGLEFIIQSAVTGF